MDLRRFSSFQLSRRAASPGGALLLALPVALLVVLAAWAAGCDRAGTPGPLAAAAPDDAWTFVGDEACASCHGDLYDSYHRTGMGRSVSRFDPATAPERFGPDGRSPLVCEPLSGYCYQAEVRGGELWQVETRPDDPAYRREYAASHVVGSGNATRSYFMAAAAPDAPGATGYLTEMPLTWYVERALWDLSPGYAQANDRFERPITLECMTCHNGTPGHEASLNFFTDVPLGITCERCHGPASAHVAAYLADDSPADPRIVNPARLPVGLQLDVCQQCHLTGETVFKPGHDPTTYRPGRPLSAHRAVFVTTESIEDPEAFGIASHAERMMRSACFDPEAPQPMTCTTCHDPHKPTAEAPAGHFNTACLSCHAGQQHPATGAPPAVAPSVRTVAQRGGTSAPASVAMPAAGDCVSCHMRKGGTSDIPHVTFTDHWIQRRPPPARGVSATGDAYRRSAPFTLVDVVRQEAGRAAARAPETAAARAEADVEAALAYFNLYDTRHRLPDYLPEIVRRLRRAMGAGPVRPDAHLVLGRALLEQGDIAGAEAALARATDELAAVERTAGAARPAAASEVFAGALAHYWLGAARLRGGAAEAAIGPLREAVARAPRLTEARVTLGEAEATAGRLADAEATLRVAVSQDPVRHAGAWNDLGLVRLQLGRLPAAREALETAVRLDPLLVPARVNLGTALLASGEHAEAARALEAALRLDPQHVPALGNLGVAQMRLGQAAAAERTFRRLLALAPGDAQARAYLEQLRARPAG